MFRTYYGFDDSGSVEEYTASKIRKGEKTLDRPGKQYYSDPKNHGVLLDDIYERILPNISDKFGMCNVIRDLILADSMDDKDRERLLSQYPETEEDIASFLADVVIFSLNRPFKSNARSPIMSERINIASVTNCKYFCGRKKELQALSEMLETHDKIFIYGVGGIGKSEFVKKFIKDNKSDFTNVLFIAYSENLKNTIAGISFKEDRSNDTIDILYTRHLNYLRSMHDDTLIVIDNFDVIPDDDENIEDVMSLNCKILFTTRNHVGEDYDIFEMPDIDKQSLFEMAQQLDVTNVENDMLDKIFDALYNHTLACELILRLLKKSAYSPDELLGKILSEHVNLDVSDRIRKNTSATYREHIHQLFRLFALTDEQKNIMRLLSLVPVLGIADEYFKYLANIPDMNVINELDEIGLLKYEEHIISVHPMIGDAAVADFSPDMVNTREFMENLNIEFQHHLDNMTNRLRQVTILDIADRIIDFTVKNDTEFYFLFLTNAFPYAETFDDEVRMKSYLSEMKQYSSKVTDTLSLAVYYMCMARFTELFDHNVFGAIELDLKALEYVPDVVAGKREYTPREISLCYNIHNTLGSLYRVAHDYDNARKHMEKSLYICRNFPTPIDEFDTLRDNLIALNML